MNILVIGNGFDFDMVDGETLDQLSKLVKENKQ